jgi:hypothetical protein
MSFFRSFKNIKPCSKLLSGVQQWPYYQDLTIESSNKNVFLVLNLFLIKSSGHCTISSELASLRHSRLHRSLYNLIYIPNDELNYFILYMESCCLSSYIKFILDINTFNKIIRETSNDNDNQQTLALKLFHRYLSIDAKELVPINNDIRRTTLCKKLFFIIDLVSWNSFL